MKKIILILSLLIATIGMSQTIEKLPNTFEIENDIINIFSEGFDVTKTNLRITDEFFSWGCQLTIDDGGKYKGHAKCEVLTWQTTIKYYDTNKKYIGFVKRKSFSSLLGVTNTFLFYDANGHKIAYSKKTAFFSTSIVLYDTKGIVIVRMERPALNLMSDSWEITIKKHGVVPNQMILLTPCFKTINDKEKRKK